MGISAVFKVLRVIYSMGKIIFVKPRVNSKNGQINVSLNRKEFPDKLLKKLLDSKELKIDILGDWD